MDVENALKDICRVCLESGANLSLFCEEGNIKVYLKVMACSTIQITEEDAYPSSICPLCYSMLNTAFEFKQKCEASDYKLRNGFVKATLKVEGEDYNFDFPDDYFDSVECDINNVKECNSSDDEVLTAFKSSQETVTDNVKISKKKEWKHSKHEIKALRKVRKRNKKPPSSRNLKRSVSNSIATSLLEEKCFWDGMEWRFDSIDCRNEKDKPSLSKLSKFKKECEEELVLQKENKRLTKKIPKRKKAKKSVNLCDTCGQIFKSKYHLNCHILLKHKVLTGSIKCQDPDCKKMFKLDHYMVRHVKRCHSAKREFICNECGKQYAFISGLRQHMKSHSENLVWKSCNFCSQKYRTQKSVDIHVRSVHTGERPSVCMLCDSAFFHDDYLKEHMRLHTGETPYKCPVCKRGYAQRGNMKSHMKQHRMSELDDAMKASMKPNYLKLLKDC